MTLVVAALVVVAALQTLLIVGLLRSHGEILRRLHALDGGDDAARQGHGERPVDFRVSPQLPQPTSNGAVHAPDIAGDGLADDVVVISVGGVPHRTLLAFLSSGCLTCQEFWDAFGGRDLGLPRDVRVVIVAKDAVDESVSALRALAPARVPFVMSSAAWTDYAVPGSPYFVLVDGVGRRVVGEGTGLAWSQVRKLIDEAQHDSVGGTAESTTEARIDRELLAAGVTPGDPSLYHPRPDAADGVPDPDTGRFPDRVRSSSTQDGGG